MNTEDIREQFRYNRWANHQLLGAIETLPPDHQTRDLASSFPSIHTTWVHVLSSEWLWTQRWNGVFPQHRLDPADFPDLDAVRHRWSAIEADQDEYLAALDDRALAQPFAYLNPKGERWEYVTWQCHIQCVTHSMYHRAQIVTMMRQLGALPVETDFLTFYDVDGGDAPRAHG